MVEVCYYLLKALNDQHLSRENWMVSLDLIMSRINMIESAFNHPKSTWYTTDPNTGLFYGTPGASRFPHMRITWDGAPERSYLRDRIDYLRSYGNIEPFEWVYTPSKDDYEGATDRCGIDARQLLELLQAIGRVAGASGTVDSIGVRYGRDRYYKRQYWDYTNGTQSENTSDTGVVQEFRTTGIDSSNPYFEINSYRSYDYGEKVRRTGLVGLYRDNVDEDSFFRYHEVGTSFGLDEDDAVVVTGTFVSRGYDVHEKFNENKRNDGSNMYRIWDSFNTSVFDMQSGGTTNLTLDWVENERPDLLIIKSLSPDPYSEHPPVGTVTATGEKKISYKTSVKRNTRISKNVWVGSREVSPHYGWTGNYYGTVTPVTVAFDWPYSFKLWGRYHTPFEYSDSYDMPEEIVDENKQSKIEDVLLKTSDTFPQSIEDLEGGSTVHQQSDFKRYVWLVPNGGIVAWFNKNWMPGYTDYMDYMEEAKSESLYSDYESPPCIGREKDHSIIRNTSDTFAGDIYGEITQARNELEGLIPEEYSDITFGNVFDPVTYATKGDYDWENISGEYDYSLEVSGSYKGLNGPAILNHQCRSEVETFNVAGFTWICWKRAWIPESRGGWPENLEDDGSDS